MKQRVLELVPPLLAGFAGAIAVETSAGVLLYVEEGLLPALTLILSVETGALGLGIWYGGVNTGGVAVERIRLRWLFSLVMFALAAALSASLSFFEDFSGSGLGQGVGLGFLGGLPLFAIGSLLGALSRSPDSQRWDLPRVGAPSVLGAALGFLMAGAFFLPNAAPYTLYLFCLVVLSGGALLQGWVLDDHPMTDVLEVVALPRGDLRVEQRVLGSPRLELTVLLEGGRVRGAETPDGVAGLGWEAAVLQGLEADGPCPPSVLLLGGGSGTLARGVLRRCPEAEIQVVERSKELVMLARSHFSDWDGWEKVGLQTGELVSVAEGHRGTSSLTTVDAQGLPTLGGMPFLSSSDWRILAGTLVPGGVMILGGLQFPEGRTSTAVRELLREGERWLAQGFLYQRSGEDGEAGDSLLLKDSGIGDPGFLVFSAAAAPGWPGPLAGFHLRVSEES